MPTISQLVRQGRKVATEKTKSPALQACPQRRGVCTRVFTTTPEEAELGTPEGGSRPADQRYRGDGLHPR